VTAELEICPSQPPIAAANKYLAQADKTFGKDCRLLTSNGGAVQLLASSG
jgi:hypothetical protein